MKYPELKFQLNKRLDKFVGLAFLGARAGGINFGRAMLADHPELATALKRSSASRRRAIISHYVDCFYQQHRLALERSREGAERAWRGKRRHFCTAVRSAFGRYPMPKGQHVAYISIFNCNSRFLAAKTFQIYHRHPAGAPYVICHELLHFIFYDYAAKKHASLFAGRDPNNGIFWDIAELFNAVVLHTSAFIRVHGIRRRIAYPAHRRYLQSLTSEWRQHQNVSRFILAAHNLLAASRHPTVKG